MGRITKEETEKQLRGDLFCPLCAGQGMRTLPNAQRAGSGRLRYMCIAKNCRSRTTRPLYAAPQILPKAKLTEIKSHKFFVITSAVNDTPIVTRAHETFKRIAEQNNGCYLVIPGVYKNPDLMHQGISNSYTWPSEVLPYICNANVQLNKSIVIKGLTRITHTAINPLAGVNAAGDTRSEVYGHPQVAMQLIATPKNEGAKMIHTTGTISEPNYGGSIRAQKAAFHHSVSALIVEIQGDKFWTREISYDGDGVADLDNYYTPSKTVKKQTVEGMVFGDVHIRSLTKKIDTVLNGVRNILKPNHQIYHDVHDHHIESHHHKTDVMFYLRKEADNELSIRDELLMSADFMADKEGSYIVDDNHSQHLNQWFNRFKPINDHINAPLYFELGEMARDDIAEGGTGNLFKLFMQKYCPAVINFPGPDDPLMIAGIDCSQHGHRGSNGARGSMKSIARSGHKTIIGHSHTPGIEKGCYQVGVMSPDLEYAQGLSSWANTHSLIYKNGSRALFHIVNNQLSPTMRRMG